MRIAGVQLPDKKKLKVALQSVYGIGEVLAVKLPRQAGVDEDKLVEEITPEEEIKIRQLVEAQTIESDLRREIQGHIKRLRDIQAYRGLRHAKRLPARGQRTKTNSRTRRGNIRQTMGTGRRKVEKK